MLIDDLKIVVEKNKKERKIFLRNLLKEKLQYYTLDYIYSSSWGKNFLFKGGTCLRFCFDLPRLSEDLDFDVKNYKNFDLNAFCEDLTYYFTKRLQIKDFNLKVSNNKQQVFLKFLIMEKLGLKENVAETNLLFLRLDIQPIDLKFYKEDVSLIAKSGFNFIVKRYSLADLFSSKIAAVLNRSFEKRGGEVTFKGRDYYDLIWFLEKGISPNFKSLESITGLDRKSIFQKLDEKVKSINISYLKEDLFPLFKQKGFVDEFCNNFRILYKNNIQKIQKE